MPTPNALRRARAAATFAATLWAILGPPRTARAQASLPAIDARTWAPSPDPDASMILEPVLTPGHLQWNAGVAAAYAEDAVVVHGGAPSLHPVVHQVSADVVGNVGLGSRFAVGVDVPFFVWQHGSAAAPASGIGDVAILGKATLLSNDRDGLRAGLGMAALADVTLPTGPRSSFMGDGAATATLRWLVEYSLGIGAVRASLGFTWRPDDRTGSVGGGDDVRVGNAIPWAIGIALRPKALFPKLDSGDRQEWEVAAHGALPAGPLAPFGVDGKSGAAALSPALLAIDDRIALGRHRDAYVLLGADVGLDAAIGVPTVRAVVSLGWAPRVRDRDHDGVPDDVDQCPDLPEDRDGIQDQDGCPEDDADGDGVPDEQDICPLAAGPLSTDPKRNGCPGAPPAPDEPAAVASPPFQAPAPSAAPNTAPSPAPLPAPPAPAGPP